MLFQIRIQTKSTTRKVDRRSSSCEQLNSSGPFCSLTLVEFVGVCAAYLPSGCSFIASVLRGVCASGNKTSCSSAGPRPAGPPDHTDGATTDSGAASSGHMFINVVRRLGEDWEVCRGNAIKFVASKIIFSDTFDGAAVLSGLIELDY